MDIINTLCLRNLLSYYIKANILSEEDAQDYYFDCRKNCETIEESLLVIMNRHFIAYKDLPLRTKSDYEFLRKACFKQPAFLKSVFVGSFHALAEMLKLMSLSEVVVLLTNPHNELTEAQTRSILSAKTMELKQKFAKAEAAKAEQTAI